MRREEKVVGEDGGWGMGECLSGSIYIDLMRTRIGHETTLGLPVPEQDRLRGTFGPLSLWYDMIWYDMICENIVVSGGNKTVMTIIWENILQK